MNNELSLLAEGAKFICAQGLTWNQGPGGNVSVKVGDQMWIKASGFQLKDVAKGAGLAMVKTSLVVQGIQSIAESVQNSVAENTYAEILRNSADSKLPRPSMETGFHVALTKKFVFHFHSLSAVLMAAFRHHKPGQFAAWMQDLQSEIGSAVKVEFIEQMMPGLLLAKVFLNRSIDADFIFLENHGLIVQGDSLDVLAKFKKMEQSFLRTFGIAFPEVKSLRATPMKVYFPDMMIMLERVRKIIRPEFVGADQYVAIDQAETIDRDALENWQATQMLWQAYPSLEELKSSIVDNVSALPTEAARLQQMLTKKETP